MPISVWKCAGQRDFAEKGKILSRSNGTARPRISVDFFHSIIVRLCVICLFPVFQSCNYILWFTFHFLLLSSSKSYIHRPPSLQTTINLDICDHLGHQMVDFSSSQYFFARLRRGLHSRFSKIWRSCAGNWPWSKRCLKECCLTIAKVLGK